MIYVDTNIFIDLIERDAAWYAWSADAVARGRGEGELVTGPIVLAELTRYAADPEELERIPPLFGVALAGWSAAASYRAGEAYLSYRAGGGGRAAILADLLTGGHAAALGAAVLTRDPRRFRAYFPELKIIAPEEKYG